MEETTNEQSTWKAVKHSNQIWNTNFTWKKMVFICLILFSGIFAQEEEIGMSKAEHDFLNEPTFLQVSQKDLTLKLGGALRFHYNYIQINSGGDKDRSQRTGSQVAWDIFALNFAGIYKSVFFNMQYRFYANWNGGIMPAYGYMGYNFSEKHQLKFGLLIKPFGGSTYHAWANTAMNFMGLEDGGGMGLHYTFDYKNYELDVVFIKNSYSRALSGDLNRFYYNSVGDEEDNQLNLRFLYHFNRKKPSNIGFSVEVGGLFNNREGKPYKVGKKYEIIAEQPKTNQYGAKWALAIHAEHYFVPNFNMRFQYGYFDFTPNDNPKAYRITPGEKDEFDHPTEIKTPTGLNAIAFGAFGDPYLIFPKGHFAFLGIEYNFDINKGVLTNISVFNDFSFLTKGNVMNEKTTLTNTLGANIHMGPVVIRPEWMLGKNHLWFSSNFEGVLLEGNPLAKQFDHRINIHIGFYF